MFNSDSKFMRGHMLFYILLSAFLILLYFIVKAVYKWANIQRCPVCNQPIPEGQEFCDERLHDE